MVNREARRTYAELVRQFISGRMTNDEYEEKFKVMELGDKDTAVDRVFNEVWFLYDDFKTHRLTGNYRLNASGHRKIAQVVLFLHGDQEYLWPRDGASGCLLFLLLTLYAVATCTLLSCFPSSSLLILYVSAGLCGTTITTLLLKCRQEGQRWQKAGDADAWPFLTRSDLTEAKRHPRLLAGRQ